MAGPINFTTKDLSVVSQNFEGFSYYPNPTKSELHLQAALTINKVTVYNLLGQKVIALNPNQLKSDMDLSKLQAGVYLMKVTIDGAVKVFRVIKE